MDECKTLIPARTRVALALVMIFVATGCQAPASEPTTTLPEKPIAEPALEPTPGLEPRQRFSKAIALLESGASAQAHVELDAYLEAVPNSRRAAALRDQITTPIEQYFPSDSFAVELVDGESLSTLARTYLGDALEFYALARFNQITDPSRVKIGQTIRIPATTAALAIRDAGSQPEVAAELPTPAAPEAEVTEAVAPSEPQTPASPADGLFAESQTHLANSDLQAAYDTLLAAVAADSGHAPSQEALTVVKRDLVDHYYRAAASAFQRQEMDLAITNCDRVLELNPDHANAKLYRAQAVELKEKLSALEKEG